MCRTENGPVRIAAMCESNARLSIRSSQLLIMCVFLDSVYLTMICALNIKYATVWVDFDLLYCCRCVVIGSFSFALLVHIGLCARQDGSLSMCVRVCV